MLDYEEIHDHIEDRACELYDILSEIIDRGFDEVPFRYQSAFRAAFALKVRSIKTYLRAFDTNPYIDLDDVREVYHEFKNELPMGMSILEEEVDALKELEVAIKETKKFSRF